MTARELRELNDMLSHLSGPLRVGDKVEYIGTANAEDHGITHSPDRHNFRKNMRGVIKNEGLNGYLVKFRRLKDVWWFEREQLRRVVV